MNCILTNRSLFRTAAVAMTLFVPTPVDAVDTIRLATYNVSLYGQRAGEIYDRLRDGNDTQAERIAAIVQTIRPDILLINEIDHDADGKTAKLLATEFFAKPQGGRRAIGYPHIFVPPCNTGIASGRDLNGNGTATDAADAWGYGRYPGQYGMTVFSRFPIDHTAIRTFQLLRWSQMPAALRPEDPATGQSYYDDDTWSMLRLSSKNHIDVPVVIGDQIVHVLGSHPTPPVFDGPEDRNGCRNHDEIRFWSDYLAADQAAYIVDDRGHRGGLPIDATAVVMGDLNADPVNGDGRQAAIRSLLRHARLQDGQPTGAGAAQGRSAGGALATATARFGDQSMRVDYVLPDRKLKVLDQGVFWPVSNHVDYELIAASDHRMVWIEVELP